MTFRKDHVEFNKSTQAMPNSMAVVLPAKGSIETYAAAELRRFVFEIIKLFKIFQYDKEN